jgi:hypothetical protein
MTASYGPWRKRLPALRLKNVIRKHLHENTCMKTLLERIENMSNSNHRKLLYIGALFALIGGSPIFAAMLCLVAFTLED